MLVATRMTLPIATPITTGIREESLLSPFDSTRQTYLVVESRRAADPAPPLLVVYLHGGTSHQDQGMTAGIYGNFFDRFWDWMRQRAVVYVCPEYRGGSWMGPAAEADLAEILRLLRERCRPSRVIVTGGSMGGTSALIFAARCPDLVDGVFALCPATDMTEIFPKFSDAFLSSYGGAPQDIPGVYRERSSRYHADALAKLPVVIVHGSADALLPVHHSRELVRQLRRRNAPVRYIEIEGGDHDALSPADIPSAMDFLLSRP